MWLCLDQVTQSKHRRKNGASKLEHENFKAHEEYKEQLHCQEERSV
jgi:hypothetical protein